MENKKGTKRADFDDLDTNGEVGDWCFAETRDGPCMLLLYPYGNGLRDVVHLPLSREAGVPKRWDWNGSEDAPTLSPSIRVMVSNQEERWHGYLRNGILETI